MNSLRIFLPITMKLYPLLNFIHEKPYASHPSDIYQPIMERRDPISVTAGNENVVSKFLNHRKSGITILVVTNNEKLVIKREKLATDKKFH